MSGQGYHVRPGPAYEYRGYGTSVGGGFSPLHQQPTLWTRGDGVELDGASAVETWLDLSGNSLDLTQAIAGSRMAMDTLGGQPAVYPGSGGAQTFVAGPALNGLGLTQGHVFLVLQLDADPPAVGVGGVWSLDVQGNDDHLPFTDGVIYDGCLSNARKSTVNPVPSFADAPRLYEVVSSATEWTNRLDGAQLFTTGVNTVAYPGAGWRLGASRTIPFMKGKMAEFIIFPTKRTAPQLVQLYAYFEARYSGLVLP